MLKALLPLLLLGAATPLAAAELAVPGPIVPATAAEQDRAAWRTAFAAIHARDWATATAAIDAHAADPIAPVARAEMLLGEGAAADPGAIATLLAAAPQLPEAATLARLASSRGLVGLPSLPPQRELVRLSGASKRSAARPSPAAAALARTLQPILKANDGATAEPLVEAAASRLSPEALTELRQRVAWAYYLGGDDGGARRAATLARGGTGDWAVQGAWVQGLAAWRAGDMAAAADAFGFVASQGRDSETVAAGLFWTARAEMGAGHPERVAPRLKSAARMGETFYGLLAGASLGLAPEAAAAAADPMATLARRPNAMAAVALAGIGEATLADQFLRYQARIGDPAEHGALAALAERLRLPATQVWLCQHGPASVVPSLAARYPTPSWSPSGGWRVDRALLLAHALQESQLRPEAVSPVGARGLMQLMPGTVRMVARHRGEDTGGLDRVTDPALNFEYGQSYLEELADHAGTGGLLPKVIAAYNAGPNNVLLWNARAGAADPLLFIESIPFAETRAYVAIVLRNYWMYQRVAGAQPTSLAELAAGRWPRFPVTRRSAIASRDPATAGTN